MTGLQLQMLPIAIGCGAGFAAVVFSLLVLWRAQTLLRAAQRSSTDSSGAAEAALGILEQKLDAVEQQLADLRRHPATTTAPAYPRAGLNLDKRSQALRMHRRGDPPSQIAAVLEIPLQEVDLLLKVHRIVLRSI